MERVTSEQFIRLLNEKEKRFAAIINFSFYYIEQGQIYRFEQNHNEKSLRFVRDFYDGEITDQELADEIKCIILKQMQYDWFTDAWKETIIENVMRSRSDIDVFFF
ncbi:hypothetical protein [Enterococcus termitis]|uniref:Uncharacterized protein n=1 Tax=Enterococcus termitis TaxID=332950 RepID=A0A1E5GSU9_9ENTE|nr:hypothetical protein [Enterococcus termitis]OEG15762.1 hypothetical protein BCR25_18615 [Enterococcus termitis]OJG96645.1 hypothetical protein RV18_GL002011 [Enterococcus termitis]